MAFEYCRASIRHLDYTNVFAYICSCMCVCVCDQVKIAVCMDICLCLFLRMQASVYSNPTEDKTISFFKCLFLLCNLLTCVVI